MLTLFNDPRDLEAERTSLGPGTALLRGFALTDISALLDDLWDVVASAPLRHMTTPGGFRMSVAMTNCGTAGWISDSTGYRYDAIDPLSGKPWPTLPASFAQLATAAAASAGFDGFTADACLINRYEPGARLTLHQDKDEQDYHQPIVSVSLGIPAIFLFGGLRRNDQPRRISLTHGDVIVWGGPARLRYHGVQPLKEDSHLTLGRQRVNLTFRKAL